MPFSMHAGRSRDHGRGYEKYESGRGYWDKSQPRKALPRPGFDDDARLKKLDDDPRYFEGAELGKAQLADLGVKGLGGMNTASFDKASTLVRPAMRVLYGMPGKYFGNKLRTDDAVAVPGFLGAEDDMRVFHELSAEIRQLRADGCEDASQAAMYQIIIKKICKYFKISEEGRAVHLEWTQQANQDGVARNPFEYGRAKYRRSKGHNCIVSVVLGAARELAFWRSSAEDMIYFPQSNGMLLFFGSDVVDSQEWKNGAIQSKAAEDRIIITIVGCSSDTFVDDVLGPRPVKKEAPLCRDFKQGRCSYGDQCRFSHLEKREPTADDAGPAAFDPTQLQVRPSMRIHTIPMSSNGCYGRPVKHDDVIIVPDFFNEKEGWDIYYQLIREMRESQAQGTKKAEWIPWHEGAHLLSQNPTGSPTYHKVLAKMRDYLSVPEKDAGTRFNWYVDGSDWKPFHHDSASFNPVRAKTQNCTIGVSFGSTRELGFRHAKSEQLVYFPQTNGMLFFFGQDANIRWQHGVNALPEAEQDGKGRISIILWGLCTLAVNEPGSPPLLCNDSRGIKGKGKGSHGGGKGKGSHGADHGARGRSRSRGHHWRDDRDRHGTRGRSRSRGRDGWGRNGNDRHNKRQW